MPDLLENMRERANLCRRLADATYDQRVADQLRQIAVSIEADLEQIGANGMPCSSQAAG